MRRPALIALLLLAGCREQKAAEPAAAPRGGELWDGRYEADFCGAVVRFPGTPDAKGDDRLFLHAPGSLTAYDAQCKRFGESVAWTPELIAHWLARAGDSGNFVRRSEWVEIAPPKNVVAVRQASLLAVRDGQTYFVDARMFFLWDRALLLLIGTGSERPAGAELSATSALFLGSVVVPDRLRPVHQSPVEALVEPDDGWKELRSATFSVEMPGVPVESEKVKPTSSGSGTVVSREWKLKTEDRGHFALVSIHVSTREPHESFGTEILELMRDELVDAIGATLENDRELRVRAGAREIPCRAFELKITPKMYMHVRVCLADQTVFQLMHTGAIDEFRDADYTRFIDSFRLVDAR